ncbi:MAG: hypothetical protein ACI4CX_00030 [Candidatus Weimeria sp.]
MTFRDIVSKLVEKKIYRFLWDLEERESMNLAIDVRGTYFAQKKDFLRFRAEVRVTNLDEGDGLLMILFPHKDFEFRGIISDDAKVIITSVSDSRSHKTYVNVLDDWEEAATQGKVESSVKRLQDFGEAIG